jgi:Peptidase family M28
MFHRKILQTLRQEVSGKRALEYVHRFWIHDRLSTFPAFHRAAEEVVKLLQEIGLSRVEHLRYPSTGTNLVLDHWAPQGWDATSGILEATDPEGSSRRIADRREDPCHLFIWCGNTPGDGVKTEIVPFGEDQDLKGKLVFQDKVPLTNELRNILVEKGALGVISDELPCWPGVRERGENMHLVRWQNAFFYPANPDNLLGFSITPANGDWLRGLLARHGQVEAFTRVDTRLYDDVLDLTTGVIPGTEESEKEVWFIQHLHEVGAHDNASGVACVMELAHALLALGERGILERPKRTIRLIFAWEIYGFAAHLAAQPDFHKNVICAMNPDMVGADQDHCRSWLQFFNNPESNPSFTDDLSLDLIREVYRDHPRWSWQKEPYMVNDNFVAEPMIDIPCPSLIFLRDRYYHTSSDTPDNLSPEVMAEMSALMGAYAYTVTNGGASAALEIADLVFRSAAEQLVDLAAENRPGAGFDERCSYLLMQATKHFDSLCELAFGDEEQRKISAKTKALKDRLEDISAACRPEGKRFSRKPESEIQLKADKLVPVRKVFGPFQLARIPEEIKDQRGLKKFSLWNHRENAPIFWADGVRSIFEIQWLVGQEFGTEPELDYLLTLFDTLAEYDYISLENR